LQGHLMARHQMWHIGRVRVQVPWVLLGRLDLLILPLHNCNTVIIQPHPAFICLIQSPWSVFISRLLGPFSVLFLFFFK
jgi:hypothetical protein